MIIDLNSVSHVLNRARGELKGGPAPMYYNHEQKRAWRDGFDYCIETFVQTALAVTRQLVADQEAKEDRAAVADPSYDRIDHLLYRAEHWGLSPAENRELREDHKRLRALEKAHQRAKVDPKRQVVVFHGQNTGKLKVLPQTGTEVNRETGQE